MSAPDETADDRVTVLRDEVTFELEEIPTGEAGQRRLDSALRNIRRGASPRSVPRAWWEAYKAARAAFSAMERDLSTFPEFKVTWHARLTLGDTVIRDDEVRAVPPDVYSAR